MLKNWLRRTYSPHTSLGRWLRVVYWWSKPQGSAAWHWVVLYGWAKSKPNTTFVQVGSNDANYGDPIRFHILKDGWRGMMIEPLPYVFKRLVKRYEGVPGLKFANVAIAERRQTRPFYHLREDSAPNLPPWYDQLGSFLRENVEKHEVYLSDIRSRITETQVQCASVAEICDEHQITHFDVLHIDTEGYDYQVLKTIDLDLFGPALILYEHKHLSPADAEAARGLLVQAGYLTNSDAVDTLAVKATALSDYPHLAKAWGRVRRRGGVSVSAQKMVAG